jgi:uncharacterized protein YjiS (DUF1127 family)
MAKSSSISFIAALASPVTALNELSKLLRRRREIARAKRQLLAMDERQLRDIGLTRADAYGDFAAIGRRRQSRHSDEAYECREPWNSETGRWD